MSSCQRFALPAVLFIFIALSVSLAFIILDQTKRRDKFELETKICLLAASGFTLVFTIVAIVLVFGCRISILVVRVEEERVSLI